MAQISKLPSKIQPAFNNIIVGISDTYSWGYAEFYVENMDTGEYFNVKRPYRQVSPTSYVEADIRKRVQTFFKEQISAIGTNGIFYDSMLLTNYSVYLYNEDAGPSLYAVNAVSQLGESVDYSERYNLFLTKFDKLKKYPGYPVMIVGAAKYDNTSKVGRNTAVINQILGFPVFGFDVYDDTTRIFFQSASPYENVTTESGDDITDNDLNPIQVYIGEQGTNTTDMVVEHPCIPVNPFYVRWINQFGGYDYWMFSTKQVYERKINGAEVYYPSIEDTSIANRNIGVASIDVENTITVGVEHLSDVDFAALQDLLTASYIQYYKNGAWQRLVLIEGQMQNDTNAPMKKLEFTFTLPIQYIQF